MYKLFSGIAGAFLVLTLNASDISRKPPLMTVDETLKPPRIDGILNDKCWQKAAAGVMLPIHDKGKMTDKSRFRLCYDKENLYVAGELYQSYLKPVMNMLNKAKAKCTTRDGALFQDDTFELFLQPTGSSEYFHLAFNMKATVYDEKGTGLSNVNKNWQSGVKAAVKQKRTKWIIELSIPLKKMSVPNNLAGQAWQVNICRSNTPKKEAYAWSPTYGSFHSPSRFGRIVFVRNTPVLQCRAITLNKEIMSLTVRGGGSSKIVFNNCIAPESIPAGNWQQLILKAVPSPQNGLTWISARANGKEILRTPALLMDNKIFNAKTKLSCPAAKMTLYINGRKLKQVKNKLNCAIPVNADENVIALEVDGTGKQLEGQITVEGLQIKPSQMLVSEQKTTGWEKQKFDHSSWQLYNGKPFNGKKYFRFTILKGYTTFAPQLNENTFYIANKTTIPIRIRIGSPFTWTQKDYVFNIKLPQGLTIPLYEQKKREWKRYTNKIQLSESTYSFRFDKPVPNLPYNFGFNVLNFLIKADSIKASTRPLKALCYMKGRGVIEIPRQFNIKLLPQLQGIKPKNIMVMLDPGLRGKVYSENEMLRLIPTISQAGINTVDIMYSSPAKDRKFIARLHKYGIKSLLLLYGINGRKVTEETWKNFPDKRFTNHIHPPKGWNRTLCPLAFMEDKLVRKNLQQAYEIFDIFCDDMERGIHATCLCKRCRQLFARENNLNNVPAVEELYNKYEKQLIDFQIRMNKRVFDYQLKLAKQTNPKIKSAVYNGYDSKLNRKQYGIDWKLYKDIDYPMAGYITNREYIMNTRNAMGGRKMTCGYLLSSNLYKEPYSNQKLKGILFHQLINSGFGGVLLWSLGDIDGRGYTAIGQFSRGVAEFENFLNEKFEIPSTGLVNGIASYAVKLLKKNNEYLMIITNLRETAQPLTIKLPGNLKQARIWDYYRNRKFSANFSFKTEISPNDALIFKFTPIQ
jgi:hypothetical protein